MCHAASGNYRILGREEEFKRQLLSSYYQENSLDLVDSVRGSAVLPEVADRWKEAHSHSSFWGGGGDRGTSDCTMFPTASHQGAREVCLLPVTAADIDPWL